VVQDEPARLARLAVEQMIDPRGIEKRSPPLDPVHDIAFAEQELRQIAAVLTGDAGQQRHFAVGRG
jgi:hypothetical protein